LIRTLPKILFATALAAALPAVAQEKQPVLPSPAPVASPSPQASPTPAPTPAAVAPAPPPPRVGCDPSAGDICLNAEKQEQVDQGHFHAEGFVDLQAGTSRIQADQLDMYESTAADGKVTRRVVAAGNVVFMHGEERLSGDRLEMDLGSSQGTFENAHGFVSSGVLVEAGKIQRVNANTYKVEDARFTSCTQPNPRWSFSASSATLKVDDHIRAHNVVFRVKDVPAFYVPYIIYPIEDDQRSTGILFPHFGQSDLRGFNVGTGFFWAMSRSYDQTFYVDTYTKSGYGLGHEFRYTMASPSRGNFRTYGFRRTDAGGWEHDVNWNAVQALPGKWLANLNVQETSTLAFQEQFQDDLDLATRRDRRSSASVQRSFGPLNVQLFADSADYFFGSTEVFNRKRHLPALVLNHSARRIGRSGLVFGFESRAERIAFGDQNGVEQYSRFDLYPRLSRPMSVSFLQVTPQVQARATRYGATATDDGFTEDSIDRRYLETSVEARGPTFSRVFENKGGFYSDRYKHVIGPEVTWTYRSKVEEFASIPQFDHLDRVLGTNELRYALVQRLYAKRPGASGKPEAYEFLNWTVAQTYYVDIANAQNEFDPNYSSAVFGADGLPAHYSPLHSNLRLRPTPRLQSTFDLQYDVNLRMMRTLSLNTSTVFDLGELRVGWNRSKRASVDPASRVLQRDTIRTSARIQPLPRRLTLEGSLDYDLLGRNVVQATARMRYSVQCCGVVGEMIQSNYNTRQERQFRFAIELANIGSIGNFMGANGEAGFLGRR
jgi:LPS-assembly protein